MGLDMYLTKHVFVGANYQHRQVIGSIKLKTGSEPIKIDLNKVSYIVEDAGYWRKANQIHKWFVDNVQDGEDDCKPYYVSTEKLKELKALCKKVIKTKEWQLLPPQEGFFFGGNEADEYYYETLKETVKILGAIDKDAEYYYQSSW